MISYAASLRIYEPLRAFPEPERGRWNAYVQRGLGYDSVTGASAEHVAGLTAAVSLPPTGAPDQADFAFVRIQDGSTYLCPARTRLRAWQALSEFRASMPEVVASAFVPLSVIENAENALEKWLVEHPDLRPHLQTVNFQVPLRWLVLVESADRELVLGERFADPDQVPAGEARRCLYRTTMAHARRRAARALNVVRRTVDDGPVVAGVEGVARWLEEFHPHALVELDYGGLVHLLDDETLAGDESPALVARSLKALESGRTEDAGEVYEQVMAFWHEVQAYETVN